MLILTGGPILPARDGRADAARTPATQFRAIQSGRRRAFTLVEMLVAMSLTLLMMSAVIAVFANVSESVSKRRASMEVAMQLTHARDLLQADLENHTCPAIPWTRPESNHGYLEIVEGPQSDFDPSIWLRDIDATPGDVDAVGVLKLDLAVSQLPSSNLGRLPGSSSAMNSSYVTDGGALGDWDDTLMLTVRNDQKPFVGRVPFGVSGNGEGFGAWGAREIESPLAEVVWFAIENPVEDPSNPTYYFGEPGFRTVYRRVLLIAPQLDYGYVVEGQKVDTGVVRVLPGGTGGVGPDDVATALTALVEFQDAYDLSVRLVWDPLLDGGRWVIKANTLSDLTKRESRFEHLSVPSGSPTSGARPGYPFRTITKGRGVLSVNVEVAPRLPPAEQRMLTRTDGLLATSDFASIDGNARLLDTTADTYVVNNGGGGLANRPFVFVDAASAAINPSTRAIVSENGEIVMFANGMAPLSGARRGEDVVLSNVLAFDIKVYDPEAPLVAEFADPANPGEIVGPGQAAWGALVTAGAPVVMRGGYVDLGYVPLHSSFANTTLATPAIQGVVGTSVFAWGMSSGSMLDPAPLNFGFQPYRTYDTWSSSYETNGLDEDGVWGPDQAVNGFDDDGVNGVDDAGERETAPPYDTPLRGVQVTLRAYELDSRQIREVNVKQTFVPK